MKGWQSGGRSGFCGFSGRAWYGQSSPPLAAVSRQRVLSTLVAGVLAGGFATLAGAEDATSSDVIEVRASADAQGLFRPEDSPVARSSVSRAAIEQRSSLSNPFQLLDLLPGVNTFSPDAVGLYGSSLRVRGFSGEQLAVTLDGVPMNDPGNFAVYPHEMTDPENLQEVIVNQGSSAMDSPVVNALGGSVGMITTPPADQSRVRLQQTFGANNAHKTFVRGDSGLFADGRAKAFISYSLAEADKWKGEGKARREHVDFKGVLNLAPGSSLTAGFLWNRIDNHNLRTLKLSEIGSLGRNADFGTTLPQHLTPVNGTAQVESAPSDGYYGFNKNRFENSLTSLKGSFQLAPALRLDVEPYYWYGRGYGGNQLTTLAEGGGGAAFRGGVRDINGDTDTQDTVMVFRTDVIETKRPGISLRLAAQVDNHRLSTGYWYDHARERRTRPAMAFDSAGNVADPWLKDSSAYLKNVDGSAYQGRDWLTVSTSQSVFLQDSIALFDDRLNLQLGIRRLSIRREFTNYVNSSLSGGADYSAGGSFAKTLPSLSALFKLDHAQQLFFNVAENFSAPSYRIYSDLLTGGAFVGGALTGYSIKPVNVVPESSTNWDLGYRYAGEKFSASGSLFFIDYRDRLAVAYDPVAGLAKRDFNVGDSTTRGIEFESAWRFQPNWSLYSSLSYTRSRINDDLRTDVGSWEATAGKQFPDTPNWLAGLSLQYREGPWTASVSAKYTGARYATLVNDQSIGGFTLVNVDASYRLPPTAFFRKPSLRLNIYNLFNTDALYLNASNGASFTTRAQGSGGEAPLYYIGAPRTFAVTLASDF